MSETPIISINNILPLVVFVRDTALASIEPTVTYSSDPVKMLREAFQIQQNALRAITRACDEKLALFSQPPGP